jgi:uroporphyrinogen decarboxylase
MKTETVPKFLRVLNGERTSKPPVWFMRQAGRYLPEYRALRAQAPDFIAFCLNPQMAAEATLQPMRRFPFDASIVFADILLLPQALGQKVWFEAGEGPKLGPLPEIAAMRDKTGQAGAYLSNVGETLGLVRAGLPAEKALIGFAGAPWTVATYMIEGGSSDRTGARTYAYTNPDDLRDLLDVLVEATIDYLAMQVAAGAQALMLFESWADGLTDSLFETLVIGPHRKIIEGLRARGIETPVIGFPRGAPALAERYAVKTPVQAVGLDTTAPLALGQRVQALKPIQGALDPLLLRAGGPALDARVEEYLQSWGAGPFIFNLGHGILPDTPIAHVERVLELVTGEKSKAL